MKALTIILVLSNLTVFGQKLKQEADQAYFQKDWNTAIKPYKKYLKNNKSDSSAWYRLGICQYETGEIKNALASLDKALENNFYAGYTLYAKAKVLTKTENPSSSLDMLAQAAEKGFSNFILLESGDEWNEYQENEQFMELFLLVKTNAYPCLSDKNARHFDFWVGEWGVYVNDQKVGENNITLAEGGCAIHESYTTPRIYSGQSINYYDRKDQKWHQTWVASNGGVLDYTEIDRAEGMLQFQCDYLNQQGKLMKSRLTFTLNEDGTVRQLFEDSEDGKSWTKSFDGLYKRKD